MGGIKYPLLQTTGFASRFAKPFFMEICIGNNGVEVGCNRIDWAFNPAADLVDLEITEQYSADNLPDKLYDWLASSHMLEHYVGGWQQLLDYWRTCVRRGGVIFLYLPHCGYQKYWGHGNSKHIHYLTPEILRGYCEDRDLDYFVSDGWDMNGSFYVVISV